MPGAPTSAVRRVQGPPRIRPDRSGAPIRASRRPPSPRSRKPGRRHRERERDQSITGGADRVYVPYPRNARSRRTIPSLLDSLRCMLSRASWRRERPLVACRCPPERLPQNRGKKQSGLRCFKNECGGVSPPDLQLREDHAARCGSDRSWLHGQDHASQPALWPRPRPLQGGARRRRADHGRLHPGSAAVSGSRGEFAASRSSPSSTSARPAAGRRSRRGRSESRRADCRSGRRHAADLAGHARKQRRCTDLWPRRDCDRGGAAARRSFGHHRASDQARRRAPRRTNEFPVLKGTIRNASGHLGQFELAIDDYALPSPPRAQNSCSALRATAPLRPAT